MCWDWEQGYDETTSAVAGPRRAREMDDGVVYLWISAIVLLLELQSKCMVASTWVKSYL